MQATADMCVQTKKMRSLSTPLPSSGSPLSPAPSSPYGGRKRNDCLMLRKSRSDELTVVATDAAFRCRGKTAWPIAFPPSIRSAASTHDYPDNGDIVSTPTKLFSTFLSPLSTNPPQFTCLKYLGSPPHTVHTCTLSAIPLFSSCIQNIDSL